MVSKIFSCDSGMQRTDLLGVIVPVGWVPPVQCVMFVIA